MRLAANPTQAAVAARLGRPQSFVAKYECGERRLDVVEFIEVAEAIEFDPVAFVERIAGITGARRDRSMPVDSSGPVSGTGRAVLRC